ncbi:beta-N-acetylhexosaminidase [Nocardioides terrae]|uniref:Beta-N-acetylhexosaminidase n=1 Tax=Nocardioides terrae TaxID=574651 RepID=A0A1I1F1N6_9ACTN|nr:glycoside hydrolase family 3 N-terminal domain-containing protein [Nocardioides terrae]SFB91080.1 beta-N-acetylhexosaminidase [Nocardioides terrae]
MTEPSGPGAELSPRGPAVETLALRVLLASFKGTTLPSEWEALLHEGLGGICLFGSNVSDGLRALTDAIHAANPAAVIATDEEGGDVTRLHVRGGSTVIGPAVLGAVDDLALTSAVGGLVAADLVAAGVDLALAPVADVNSNPDNPVIGSRSFASDPTTTAAHVGAWVRGLQSAGVAACAKHFPGHGDTGEDSHLALPVLDVSLETLRQRELVPFVAAVHAGVRTVMTSHIVVPALDPQLPGTLSAPVLGLLRDELGFDGVIVSDALDMAGASGSRSIPEAAVLSLAAGTDLLCVGPDKPAALVREVQAAIVRAVEDDRLPLGRLEEAAARVAELRTSGDMAAPPTTSQDVLSQAMVDAAARALVVEGELPDLAGATVLSVDTRANIAVGDVPWGLTPDLTVPPGGSTADLGSGPVIVQVRDAHRRPEVGDLLDRLAEAGRTAVVVEWGWPGPRHGSFARICTRGCSRPGAEAVTDLLRKAGWNR